MIFSIIIKSLLVFFFVLFAGFTLVFGIDKTGIKRDFVAFTVLLLLVFMIGVYL